MTLRRRHAIRHLPLLAMAGLGLGLALGGLPAFAQAASGGPVVATAAGRLEGLRSGTVESFRGVPFAAPPIGALRWRAPQPAAAWQGVREATRYGPDCMQWPLDEPPSPAYLRPTSEDCLTLNVWRPAGAKAGAKLPVMVWIYGGAFAMGSASWPVYEGANLASRGVIVVGVNYRLARFGWFAHPALTAAGQAEDGVVGNYGLMDQMAGLRWVRDNIASFGGDPEKVTLFGESAGAFSVNALMASPRARGLFARAISQSGGGQKGFGRRLDTYLPEAEKTGLDWTRSLGIADGDLAAMRALPAATVLGPHNPLVLGGIIIDGTIVPRPVDEAFLAGAIAPVPYMVGANSWEESLLKYIPGGEAAVVPGMGRQAAELLALYDKDAPDRSTAMKRLWGDAFMVAPARFLARRAAATGQPTWLYHFSYVPVAARGTIPGARHSAEISLAMRNETTGAQFEEGPADAPMAEAMSAYWLNFARTGNPNHNDTKRGDKRTEPAVAVAWPRYDATGDRLLEFADTGPVVRAGFDRKAFDLIDAAYYERAGLTPPKR